MNLNLSSEAQKAILSLVSFGLAFLDSQGALADVRLCQMNSGRNKGTVVSVAVPDSCPANSTQILYQADLFGSGTTNLRVSAGRTKAIGGHEQNYNNCTIAAGATLTMPSGSILRCNGDFINNGFVTVGEMSRGGSRVITDLSTYEIEGSSAGTSIGGFVARHGAVASTTTDTVRGASVGATSFPASALFFPGQIGGGGGGAGLARTTATSAATYAGNGGGVAVILVRGNFENSGVIAANGGDSLVAGGGGGGGGFLVIGVKGELVNTATISARGGAGGAGGVDESAAPSFAVGGGGGGTGGFIHYVAGSLSVGDGVTDVTGGPGGVASGNASGSVAIRAG